MKKIRPYFISLLLGCIFGFIIFNQTNFDIKEVFKESIQATGFQLGVFNKIEAAKELNIKYPSSIIIEDHDVFRVYYSILTNDKTIKEMENYLNNNKIAFYKKEITVNDSGLIKALNNYESSMLKVNDNTFNEINKLIMGSYGGNL